MAVGEGRRDWVRPVPRWAVHWSGAVSLVVVFGLLLWFGLAQRRAVQRGGQRARRRLVGTVLASVMSVVAVPAVVLVVVFAVMGVAALAVEMAVVLAVIGAVLVWGLRLRRQG